MAKLARNTPNQRRYKRVAPNISPPTASNFLDDYRYHIYLLGGAGATLATVL